MLVVHKQPKRFNFMENENGWRTDENGWKGEPEENENQKKKEIETQQNKNINTLDEKVH
jgi:hypothetical protein